MAMYIPRSIFSFGAAFVCQAGNFWTHPRIIRTIIRSFQTPRFRIVDVEFFCIVIKSCQVRHSLFDVAQICNEKRTG